MLIIYLCGCDNTKLLSTHEIFWHKSVFRLHNTLWHLVVIDLHYVIDFVMAMSFFYMNRVKRTFVFTFLLVLNVSKIFTNVMVWSYEFTYIMQPTESELKIECFITNCRVAVKKFHWEVALQINYCATSFSHLTWTYELLRKKQLRVHFCPIFNFFY